jgi:hypothetical protein
MPMIIQEDHFRLIGDPKNASIIRKKITFSFGIL